MEDINRVTITCRVVKQTECKYTNGGTPTLSVPVAINRRRKIADQWQDEASYIDIQFWGKFAESMAKKLVKGVQMTVAGELRQDRWEQDGQQKSKIVIVVEKILIASKVEVSNGF